MGGTSGRHGNHLPSESWEIKLDEIQGADVLSLRIEGIDHRRDQVAVSVVPQACRGPGSVIHVLYSKTLEPNPCRLYLQEPRLYRSWRVNTHICIACLGKIIYLHKLRRGGEIGRRARLKIWLGKLSVGSNPTLGTTSLFNWK